MSNSATHLDLIQTNQAQKEITANCLFDAASPAMLYGRRATTTSGLTWGYFGGCAMVAGEPTAIANGTLALTPSATNYIQASPTTGAVSVNTSGFTAGAKQLYEVVTGASAVTSYADLRTLGADAGGAIDDAIAAHEAEANPHPGYLTQAEGDARYLQTVPAQPFDLTAFYPGVPTASAKVTRVPVARAITFPANFSGGVGVASVAATGSTAFDVKKNASSVGTITFAAGATTATFATSGGAAVTFAAGDYLSIIAPASPDVTLADVGLVLAGTR
jgi:hypothetical protein